VGLLEIDLKSGRNDFLNVELPGLGYNCGFEEIRLGDLLEVEWDLD
jgi:hypothetical protein